MRVVWSREARDELVEILMSRLPYSEEGAIRVVRDILRRGQQLELFPASGRPLDEFGTDFREVFAGPYRIIYRTSADAVEVLAVRHGRRELRPPR